VQPVRNLPDIFKKPTGTSFGLNVRQTQALHEDQPQTLANSTPFDVTNIKTNKHFL